MGVDPFFIPGNGDYVVPPRQTYADMIHAIKRDKQQGRGPGGGGGGFDLQPSQTIVYVKNTTASAVRWNGVLGIDDWIIDPADNLTECRSNPMVSGTTPATGVHEGKFVVCIDPIDAGKIGRGIVSGVVLTQVNIIDTNDTHADVTNVDTTQLTSATRGSAQILWKESGLGTKWALVRIGSERGQDFDVTTPDDWLDTTVNDFDIEITHTNPGRPLAGGDIAFTAEYATGGPGLADDMAGTVTLAFDVDTLKFDNRGHSDDAEIAAAQDVFYVTGDDSWTSATLSAADEISIEHVSVLNNGATPDATYDTEIIDAPNVALSGSQSGSGVSVTLPFTTLRFDTCGHYNQVNDEATTGDFSFTVPDDIGDLADVDMTTNAPVTGDLMQYNGTSWVPVTLMEILDDVSGYNSGQTQFLRHVSGTLSWKTQSPC